MMDGLKRHGIYADIRTPASYVAADLCIAYGWVNEPLFQMYRASGANFIYIDLGFWLRKPAGQRWNGYHKVVVNGWCPLSTMKRGCPNDRFSRLGIHVEESTTGDVIVIAGMSGKSATGHGLVPMEWEEKAIADLAAVWSGEIVYRPKPSWTGAKPLEGALYSPSAEPLAAIMSRTRAVVTHHSNAAVDALVSGRVTYCETGVGAALSTAALVDVVKAKPHPLETRKALMNDIAYIQWKPDEMASGECWAHVRSLLP